MTSFLLTPLTLAPQQRSPWYFVITIVLAVFCAETFVMLALMQLPELPAILEAVVDATFLSILITPIAYFFIFCPFTQQLEEQTLIEAELRQAQEQSTQRLKELARAAALIQTEKMSGLSRMVAGLAHELNNPVTFIHGNLIYVREYIQTILEVIQCYQRPGVSAAEIAVVMQDVDLEFMVVDLRNILSSMQDGSDRIRQIVLDLRTFARMDEVGIKPVNIHLGIESTLMLSKSRLNPSGLPAVQVIKEYTDLPLVSCNPAYLNQAILNLINNAIEALSSVSNPTIWVRTQIKTPGWVCIIIQDNGVGIPAPMMDKIFDPFFTTKPIGKGTGLGLAVSYQIIVDHHGGNLKCFSELGKGTEFQIDIPIR